MIRLYTAIYLGFWVALAVTIAYFGTTAGVSPWLSASLVFIAFFFINGSLTYLFLSRRLKGQGKTPPPFLQYLFQTEKLNQPTPVPTPVRVVLGLIVIFGGALFILGGGVFVSNFDRAAVLLVGFAFLFLGFAFLYVGYRVIRMNRPNRRLFGPDRVTGLPDNSLQPTPNDGAAERTR